ncbi:surface lipoprotein assembly modifier [Testudinibacter sp. P27/CKL/0425]
MQKYTLFISGLLFANPLLAEPISNDINRPENIQPIVASAQAPSAVSVPLPEQSAPQQQISWTATELLQNRTLTENLLNYAIQARNPELIGHLLEIYRTFPERDHTLQQFAEATQAHAQQDYTRAIGKYRTILAQHPELNPVRIELAKALFHDRQDSNAREQFEKAKSAVDVPPAVSSLINSYLNALQQRSGWQSDISAYYVRDSNVNNTASNREIENTGFVKGDSMLPQTAHGIAYAFNLQRDFNLADSHYLHFNAELNGKNYWDNHEYDDIYQRTSLGYSNKSAVQTWSILPFYEKRWYGNTSYQWGNGVRGEYRRWLNDNIQLSSALEYAKQYYYGSDSLNGNNKLASATLLWQRNPRQYFYLGSDYSRTQTKVRQYSYNQRGLRLGWGQEWGAGISSRISVSATSRHYKDQARLGGILPLGKTRSDKIYSANLTLWKRDWHFWGITPKLHFNWKKQDSNLPSMYSYSQKNVNLIFEKTS